MYRCPLLAGMTAAMVAAGLVVSGPSHAALPEDYLPTAGLVTEVHWFDGDGLPVFVECVAASSEFLTFEGDGSQVYWERRVVTGPLAPGRIPLEFHSNGLTLISPPDLVLDQPWDPVILDLGPSVDDGDSLVVGEFRGDLGTITWSRVSSSLSLYHSDPAGGCQRYELEVEIAVFPSGAAYASETLQCAMSVAGAPWNTRPPHAFADEFGLLGVGTSGLTHEDLIGTDLVLALNLQSGASWMVNLLGTTATSLGTTSLGTAWGVVEDVLVVDYTTAPDDPSGLFTMWQGLFDTTRIRYWFAPGVGPIRAEGYEGAEVFARFEVTRIDGLTAVADVPAQTRLEDAIPNPFNPSTTIAWTLPKTARAQLEIFDAMGRLVTTLFDEEQPAGPGSIVWNGSDATGGRVSSGVYFYRLTAGDFEDTKRMVLIK